ncbi:MAG: hypothetical protein LUQ59_08735, partial [Methanothrix sp.]|nr:hypothetical protein [Methanothrix sp.]
MEINPLMFSMAIAVIICLYPVMALGSADIESDDESWIVYDAGEDASRLVDEGPAGSTGALQDAGLLAIIDSSRKKTKTDLEMPSGSYMRLSLVPGASGQLQLFCLYPTGSVEIVLNAAVKKDHSYTTLYQAGLEGDYELWFTVGTEKSNSVKLKVQEADMLKDSTSALSSGAGPSSRIRGSA